MKNVFLILGYGVPEDIFEDGNYARYLKAVFEDVSKMAGKGNKTCTIIFSGGMTDMFEPYERSEAGEMKRYFESLIGERIDIKNWKLLTEEASLSTLENLTFTKGLLERKEVLCEALTIFFEITREKRVRTLANEIFPNTHLAFIPIDFDESNNRYLDIQFIQAKEAAALKQDLKALNEPDYRKKYRSIYEEKFTALRNAKPEERDAAIKKWWEKEMKEFAEG